MQKTMNRMIAGVFVALFAILAISSTASANTYHENCPFTPKANRTIVNFDTDFVWGNGSPTEVSRNVNLPAGDYKISAHSFDGYEDRSQTDPQINESYFMDFRNGTSKTLGFSAITPDLQDGVTNASWHGVTNNNFHIAENITRVVARHSNYLFIDNGRDSVTAGCAAFDLLVPADPILNVSCSANPSTVNVNENVSWSSTVSGGNGSYSYSWTGTDGLSAGNINSTSKSYSTSGTKTANVTVLSGSQSITKSCTAVINQVQNQTLAGSCSVTPTSVMVGGYLNWSSTASGGNGSYTYSWSGTDGLVSTSNAVSKQYNTTGTKTGIVTISSPGSNSVSYTCSAPVNETINNNLFISCEVDDSSVEIDEDVHWSVDVSGGTGSYVYDWDGDEGLHGTSRTVTWSYDDDGTKEAEITVTSGNETKTDTCTTKVQEDNSNDDLNVSCYANPTNVQVGQQMSWYATVSGGDGDYDYDWEGDDGLNTSSRSPSKTYNSSGNKEAEVTVTDGDGNEDTDTCEVNVNQNSVLAFSQVNQLPYDNAIYLSQVPYTGFADDFKLPLFVLVLALFSAWMAFVVVSYKKSVGELN